MVKELTLHECPKCKLDSVSIAVYDLPIRIGEKLCDEVHTCSSCGWRDYSYVPEKKELLKFIPVVNVTELPATL